MDMTRLDMQTLQGLLRDVGADPGPVDGLWGARTKSALYAAANAARGDVMTTSPEGIWGIVLHEGIVPGPYYDSKGIPTAYVGHTAAAGAPDPAKMPRGMPADLDLAIREAVRVFKRDLAKFEARVIEHVKVPLAHHEFDALVSFDYNSGGVWYREKATGQMRNATAISLLNDGNRSGAANALMNWRSPPEIIPRREAERDLFANGTYPDGKANVWPVTEAGKVVWRPVRTLTKADFMELMA